MIWVLVPILGAGLVWALVSMKGAPPTGPAYQPPPPGPAAPPSGPSPARAMTYLQRLDTASIAYMGTKFIPGSAETAKAVLVSTLDVVGGMAMTDAAAGRISDTDLANVNAKIAAIKKTL